MTTPHGARPVVRYDLYPGERSDDRCECRHGFVLESVSGDFVLFREYDALRSEVERLRDQLREARAESDTHEGTANQAFAAHARERERAEAAEATLDDFIEAAEHYFNTGVADALRAVLNDKINAQGDEGND